MLASLLTSGFPCKFSSSRPSVLPQLGSPRWLLESFEGRITIPLRSSFTRNPRGRGERARGPATTLGALPDTYSTKCKQRTLEYDAPDRVFRIRGTDGIGTRYTFDGAGSKTRRDEGTSDSDGNYARETS